MPSWPRSYLRMMPTGRKPTFCVAPDGARVGGSRIDGDAVVSEVVEQMARQRAYGVGAEPVLVVVGMQRDVDARVPVLGVGLLVRVDHADHRAV